MLNLNTILGLIPHEVEGSGVAKGTIPNVELSNEMTENTYEVATWLMSVVKKILSWVGLEHNDTIMIWLYAILVFLVAYAVGILMRTAILWIARTVVKRYAGEIYPALSAHKFFTKISRIVTPFVFLILIQFTLTTHALLAMWLTRLTWIYVVFVFTLTLTTVVNVVWEQVDQRRNKKKLPLRGLVQLAKGILWILAIIVWCAILLDKSPGSLLAGLGAFAAVLMLVFKDSILGVVAGVQLSENDSLHEGDWIKVSGTDANGTVTEVTLTTVKVENWDKTVTCLPPYQLVSGSFTNYRNMQESGTRRIQRSYMIDADSVVEATDEMLAKISALPFMGDYISKKKAQRAAGKVENVNNSEGLVDGSIETNLGLFRAYAKMYLDANQHIDKNSDCFVTTLAQTAYGIPLQVYCFTTTSKWFPYEAIQASIFEHFAVMLWKFGLYTYEQASGRDTIAEGYLEANTPQSMFGVPYPFLKDSAIPMPQSPLAPSGENTAPKAEASGADNPS